MSTLDTVDLGIIWNRLIAITDELQAALIRTSFSTIVREGGDLSCVLFDGDANAIAQGSYSLPSFTSTAPLTLRHMLAKIPPEALKDGDVVVTNDPWMGTGHLFDISVMRPVFRGRRLVGYTMSVTHLPDIGGDGWTPTSSEIYQEGLRLPICKLVEAGSVNERIIELISANVRTSEQVIGDIMANVTCNEVGGRLLLELLDEYQLESLDEVSRAIRLQSETALGDALATLPDGVYRNSIEVEGQKGPVATLSCAIDIRGRNVSMDFGGTSASVPIGINVPYTYTRAIAIYALKCLTVPLVPNNDGFSRPIDVVVPEGSILGARHPAATAGRHTIGLYVAPLVFGALADVLPDRVPADAGMSNPMNMQGVNRRGEPFSLIFFCTGGFGAMADGDGLPTLPFPSNMSSVPVEVWEDLTSVRIECKRLLADSGGAGAYRGGLGQCIDLVNDTGNPLTVSFFGARNDFPAMGLHGGKPGKRRQIWLNDTEVRSMSKYVLQPGDRIRTHEAGGGGYGDPRQRPRERVLSDVAAGFVTRQAAKSDYGVDIG